MNRDRKRIVQMLRKATWLGILACCLAQANAPAQATPAQTTWYVDAAAGDDGDDCQSPTSACQTIGAAMARANTDDIVQISAGVYVESLEIPVPLTLLGAGRSDTFLDGGDARRVLLNAQDGVTLQSLTVRHGLADGENGGGILNLGTLLLQDVTVTANTVSDGGGVRALGGVGVTAANSIIAANHDDGNDSDVHPDCSRSLTSEGYNLLGIVSGCNILGDTAGNQLGVDPLLGPLQNNGGSTLTHALLENSPAIDGGNPGGCFDGDGAPLTTDQRGFDRPGAGSARCDSGAYEKGAPPPPTATPSATAQVTPTMAPTPTATSIPPGSYWQYLPAIFQ